jgi:hypothetical protein
MLGSAWITGFRSFPRSIDGPPHRSSRYGTCDIATFYVSRFREGLGRGMRGMQKIYRCVSYWVVEELRSRYDTVLSPRASRISGSRLRWDGSAFRPDTTCSRCDWTCTTCRATKSADWAARNYCRRRSGSQDIPEKYMLFSAEPCLKRHRSAVRAAITD